MGMRYRKRISVLPGVKLNISRSSRGWTHSWSLSAFGVTHNTRSGRRTVDLPGGLYYTTGGRKGSGKGSRNPSRKGSQPRRTAEPETTPAPYRPRRWPYALLAVLTFLAVVGGAVWQGPLLFGLIALAVFGVQRWRSGDATPAEPEPEPEAAAMDPAEAERIVRDWTPPPGRVS